MVQSFAFDKISIYSLTSIFIHTVSIFYLFWISVIGIDFSEILCPNACYLFVVAIVYMITWLSFGIVPWRTKWRFCVFDGNFIVILRYLIYVGWIWPAQSFKVCCAAGVLLFTCIVNFIVDAVVSLFESMVTEKWICCLRFLIWC